MNTTATPGYCERCEVYSSNMTIHKCEQTFTIAAEEALRMGDHEKVREIVERARARGVELIHSARFN